MSATEMSRPLPVRGGHNAWISFDSVSPSGADLVIDYLRSDKLLARERRPAAAVTALEIKTHPEASHVACSLRVGDHPIDGASFNVACDQPFEPTARHFIVIGAMKAGTTTLFELLAQHPALCRTWVEVPGHSSTKEINYFRHLYQKNDTPLHYDWRFPFEPGTHAWTLDVSPSYAKWPTSRAVPSRVASLGGETKVAYILRDPIDRIESHIAHKLHTTGKFPKLEHCIRTSEYASQLDKFTAHIERDDILLLDFAMLQRKPAAILAQVCEFLGVDRFISRTVVHNSRSVDFGLDAKQRAELAETLRPDVQRLIDDYGFKPAERWLRKPVLSWFRRPRTGSRVTFLS